MSRIAIMQPYLLPYPGYYHGKTPGFAGGPFQFDISGR